MAVLHLTLPKTLDIPINPPESHGLVLNHTGSTHLGALVIMLLFIGDGMGEQHHFHHILIYFDIFCVLGRKVGDPLI